MFNSKAKELERRVAELERQNIELVNLVSEQYKNLAELWEYLREVSVKAGVIEPEKTIVECMGSNYGFIEDDPWPKFI